MKKLLAALLLATALPSLARAQTIPVATTNASVTITTGNTFQVVLNAVTLPNARRTLTIENNNTSDACWIYLGAGTAAKGTSISLAAGARYTREGPYVPADEVQATCATSADTLYVDYQ